MKTEHDDPVGMLRTHIHANLTVYFTIYTRYFRGNHFQSAGHSRSSFVERRRRVCL